MFVQNGIREPKIILYWQIRNRKGKLSDVQSLPFITEFTERMAFVTAVVLVPRAAVLHQPRPVIVLSLVTEVL